MVIEILKSEAKLCPFDLQGIESITCNEEIGFQSLWLIIWLTANRARFFFKITPFKLLI